MKHVVWFVRVLSLFVLSLSGLHPVNAAPVPRDVPWCGTNRFGVIISDAVHRQQERRLVRERAKSGAPATVAQASSLGNIAVLNDDGGMVVQAAPFDPHGRSAIHQQRARRPCRRHGRRSRSRDGEQGRARR